MLGVHQKVTESIGAKIIRCSFVLDCRGGGAGISRGVDIFLDFYKVDGW